MHLGLPTIFLLLLSVVAGEDVYASDPNIYELTPSNFDKVVHKSNYTSIVKFYAPWCGYCKQLTPIYKKLGKFFHKDGQYAVNVVAVNCDKDYNKPLCSKHRVSGFPTLMVFRPPKYNQDKPKPQGVHAMETYSGERSLKSIMNFVNSRIKNYVKKFNNPSSDSLRQWLSNPSTRSKVVLFTESNSIHNMYKSLAIDFLNSTEFSMVTVKDKDLFKQAVADLNLSSITDFPMLFNVQEGELVRFDRPKLDDKLAISKWLIEQNGHLPVEGQLSKKDRYYSKYRGIKEKKPKEDRTEKPKKEAKKKTVHDEL